jgi:hypothetical protein
MAKIDIYTYFTADQMRRLLIDARYGTARMLKGIQKEYATDSEDLLQAIADCMPQLLAEDRVYKSGPRRGQRKIVFRRIDTDISTIVAEELTGCATIQEFTTAYNYCGIYGGAGKTMVETVLAPPVASEQYAKHWIKCFLDCKAKGFPNLKIHFLNMTVEPMARAQKAVDAWIATNQPDMAELGTWDGRKYNEWHFAQRQQAVA